MTESGSIGPTADSVDDFIASNDPDGSLTRIDAVVAAALPGAARVLWQGAFWGGTGQSIIGYGDIQQPRPKGKTVNWFLIGLARQKNHVSLYVNAVENSSYLSQLYGDQLGKTKVGSASVSFKSADDVDLGVLHEMVRHAGRLMEWT